MSGIGNSPDSEMGRHQMENGFLVSVIIPVFNVAPYLAEALDSVLCQTYENLEIIVIDDGSTDGSGGVCDEYAKRDRRVRVIHQENRGLSSARNAGLDLATGKAIAFLDPDDAYHPDYVGAMVTAMIREKADIVLCKYTIHESTGRMKQTGRQVCEPKAGQGKYDRVDALRALADDAINLSVWNKLYTRELWRDIRFPDGHNYEDIITTYRIVDICKTLYVLDQLLYLHRTRPGSISESYSWQNIHDLLLAHTQLLSFVEKNTPGTFSKDHLNHIHGSHLRTMIRCYLRCPKREKCDRELSAGDLKKMIVDAGRERGLKSYSLRVKTAYLMLITCPFLLKMIYPPYHRARLFIRVILSRRK